MQNMSKITRKRKLKNSPTEESETDAPKTKTRFDEELQAEEDRLNEILFGNPKSFLKRLEEAEQEPGTSNIDSGVGEDESCDSEDASFKPVWHDDEDDGVDVGDALKAQRRKLPNGGINSRSNKYSSLLKSKFESTVGTPKWASLNKRKNKFDEDSDEEILHTVGFIAKKSSSTLPPNTLEFKKVKDLNCETYNEGPFINSIEFHPTSSVALISGNSGIMSLFAVDGKRNNKLHSVAFEKYPICCAKFINNGNEAILGSRHKFAFKYDLLAAKHQRFSLPPDMTRLKDFVVSPDSKIIAAIGKWGEIHIISSTSLEKITTLKQDSEVTALEFNANGNLLFGHSDTGNVTIFDINTRRVKHKFVDDGCLQGSALSISSSNQFIATGSAQGIVNIYNMDDALKNKEPKPKMVKLNLTTSITNLKFNATSEMLAFSSGEIPNSVKLMHLGSGSVYNNFLPFGSKIGNINSLNFSPGSGYIALGNRKSVVALYRLKHYKNY